MVTITVAKGTALTIMTVIGMFVGFRVQDVMRQRAEVRPPDGER
jgi:hypothetical protein